MKRLLTTVLVGFLTASPALAQIKPEVKVVNVRAGVPLGPMAGKEDSYRPGPMFKAGHWTPVQVTVEGKGSFTDVDLTVRFADSDELLSDYTLRIPVLEFSAEQVARSFVTYARPSKADSPLFVRLRSRDQDLCPEYEASLAAIEANDYLYLTIGSKLPGLRPPEAAEKGFRRTEVGAFDRVAELPDRWYGYQTADLVIWTTSDEKFTDSLLTAHPAQLRALMEWVKRGGKLVVSVAKNRGLLANNNPLQTMLPVKLEATTTPESVRINFWDIGRDLSDPQTKNRIDLTTLKIKSGSGARVLATPDERPLVVQAPYGFGRVTV